MKTVVGLFTSHHEAQQAIQDLTKAGIDRDLISLVANTGGQTTPVAGMAAETEALEKGASVGQDAAAGAIFGGVGGILLAVAAAFVPGLGALAIAGPIMATLGGAVTGAAGGAVIGALQDQGIPEYESHVYAESVRRGGTMLMVHADDTLADDAADILHRHGAVDVEERGRQLKESGWQKYDEKAEPYKMNPDDRMLSIEPNSVGGPRASRVFPYAGETPKPSKVT